MSRISIISIIIFLTIRLNGQDQNSAPKHIVLLDVGISSSSDISFGGFYNDNKRLFAPTAGFTYLLNITGIHWIATGVSYYQVGDVYDYFTGRNQERTDVRIYVNTIQIPFLFSMQFEGGKSTNFFVRAGPSIDLVIGESIISPFATLNNPDGFRENVSQGKVLTNVLPLLNLSTGLTFKNKNGGVNYLELIYYGTVRNIFQNSDPRGESSYRSFAIKTGFIIFRR